MLALQQTAAVVLKRAAATTPQAFERATGLRVLHMSPAVVVVDKPTGLRSVPAYGPTRALLADFARRQAAGEADLQEKFERPTRRDRWCVTQCDFRTFPNLSCVDGVVAMPHRLDALDVAVRESTRLVSERRKFRDAIVRHRCGVARDLDG